MPAATIIKKEIPDFIADTVDEGFARRPLWSAVESGKLLLVEVFSIEPGKDTGIHYHWDRVELVICLRGRGKVKLAELQPGAMEASPQWQSPSASVDIAEGDTFVIPKGALHQYAAADVLANQDPKDLDKHPAKLVLIVLHPLLNEGFEEKAGNFPPSGSGNSAQIVKRNYRDDVYCKFDRKKYDGVHLNRAIRSRIWGRDAQGSKGEADAAKEQLHLTLYTFVPGQLNPGHFHPNSVEWVACVQGRARMTVRAKKNGKGWNAPDPAAPPNRDTLVIREGDSVLVTAADWHQYITEGNDDCLLIVSQTPHPILHILEHETNF